MKKLILLSIILSIALAGSAKLKPKHVTGQWKYEVDTGGSYLTGKLVFTETDGALKGEINTDDGYTIPMSKIEIKDDDKLYIEAKTEYDVIKLDLKVDGDAMTGMGSSSEGDAPIKCSRVKE
jgi:hypothetical protein